MFEIHSFILNIYIAPLKENYSETRDYGCNTITQ